MSCIRTDRLSRSVRNWMAFALCACAIFALTPRLALAQSPEFYQLLNEVQKDLRQYVLKADRPVCAPAMASMGKEAILSNLLSTGLSKVVVEPLEAGGKVALGALGVPGLVISTYSMMRCAQGASGPADFGKCALGEAAGFAGGKGLEKLGVENLEGALSGWAWDQAYGVAKGAWDAYGQTSEDLEWEAGGDCKLKATANWSKRPRAGALGGMIFISVTASDCKCSTGNALKNGNFRVNVPVQYTPSGNRQPGFSAGSLQDIRIEATCCGNPGTDPNVYVFNADGRRTAIVRPGDGMPDPVPAPAKPPRTASGVGASPPAVSSTPPSQPPATTPKPKPQPAPPLPVWPPANADYSKVCPECNQYTDAISKLQAEIAQSEQRATALQSQLSKAQADAANAEAEIARARNELKAQESTGGSAFDPDTGLTTEAFTQADGRVRIRVIDGSGKVLDERFRDRRDLTAARKRLADNEQKLQQARAEEARAQQALTKARQDIARAQSALRSQQALYEECIERCRRKVLFGEPPMAQLIAVPVPVEFSGGGVTPSLTSVPALSVSQPVVVPPTPAPTPVLATLSGGAVNAAGPSALGALDDVRAACRECEDTAKKVNKARSQLKDSQDKLERKRRQVMSLNDEIARIDERVGAVGAGAPDEMGFVLLNDKREKLREDREDARFDRDSAESEVRQNSTALTNTEANFKRCIAEKCKDFGACAVEIERVNNIVGNNPFDPIDPLRDSSDQSSSSSFFSSPSGSSCGTNPWGPNVGSYSCSGSCSILSVSLALSGDTISINSIDQSTGADVFNVCGDSATSQSSTLTYFADPRHSCAITRSGANFAGVCTNNSTFATCTISCSHL